MDVLSGQCMRVQCNKLFKYQWKKSVGGWERKEASHNDDMAVTDSDFNLSLFKISTNVTSALFVLWRRGLTCIFCLFFSPFPPFSCRSNSNIPMRFQPPNRECVTYSLLRPNFDIFLIYVTSLENSEICLRGHFISRTPLRSNPLRTTLIKPFLTPCND